MLISEEYKKLNTQLHETNEGYGTSGHSSASVVREMCERINSKDVLDYGCGKGTLKQALGFDINQYDPAIKEFESEPAPADIVVCTDVLEHIEPENLRNVLAHIEALTKKVAYFVVATRPAKKILADGRNAHLIVEDTNFWVRALSDLFVFQHIASSNGAVTFICSKMN